MKISGRLCFLTSVAAGVTVAPSLADFLVGAMPPTVTNFRALIAHRYVTSITCGEGADCSARCVVHSPRWCCAAIKEEARRRYELRLPCRSP